VLQVWHTRIRPWRLQSIATTSCCRSSDESRLEAVSVTAGSVLKRNRRASRSRTLEFIARSMRLPLQGHGAGSCKCTVAHASVLLRVGVIENLVLLVLLCSLHMMAAVQHLVLCMTVSAMACRVHRCTAVGLVHSYSAESQPCHCPDRLDTVQGVL
jgi:hypothetical protein